MAEASFVRAPLNSRLPPTPSAAHRDKGKEKERVRDHQSLGELDTDIQEALILEDLLNVLTGIEGVYITYDEDYNPEEADEEMMIRGPQYVVGHNLSPS